MLVGVVGWGWVKGREGKGGREGRKGKGKMTYSDFLLVEVGDGAVGVA